MNCAALLVAMSILAASLGTPVVAKDRHERRDTAGYRGARLPASAHMRYVLVAIATGLILELILSR